MGGEKLEGVKAADRKAGSPPRGRGKAALRMMTSPRLRITPAWAGKRQPEKIFFGPFRDHPRVGGEKSLPGDVAPAVWGSPPRGRGKADLHQGRHVRRGITPAWAGKRGLGRCSPGLLWDHPRVGGEKSPTALLSALRTGSPPRGRGKAAAGGGQPPRPGITPAWAGKRRKRVVEAPSLQDHPRVGGEKSPVRRPSGYALGSPPRGRGKD